MPPHIMSRIYRFACYNPDGVTFDLDTRTLHGVNTGLFQRSKFALSNTTFGSNISHTNHVTIQATSDTVVTDFNGFGHLSSLTTSDNGPKIFESMINMVKIDDEPLILSLTIYPQHAATLSDVKINIEKLMELLLNCKLHPKATIKLTLICPSGWQEQTTISIAKLQRQLFLLFSDMISEMRKFPVIERPHPGRSPLPWEIWINGHGKLLNSIYPSWSLTYAFRHGHLSAAEINVLGSQRSITTLNPTARSRYPSDLVHAWKDLRDMHWPEWKQRSHLLKALVPPF
ncbi:hypothetical protein PtrV1_13344 [Pyrenophora tritici-repentis]|nr:hypothetical protein PtrV1_13344 [Pyrenophora tritici-repentis]KAF7446705.1 hypothetical protein A1F99_081520 [Pyrenophora tritici-repentis]